MARGASARIQLSVKEKKLRLQKSNAVMLSREFYVTNVKTAITRAGKIKKLTNHTLNWIVKLPSN